MAGRKDCVEGAQEWQAMNAKEGGSSSGSLELDDVNRPHTREVFVRAGMQDRTTDGRGWGLGGGPC